MFRFTVLGLFVCALAHKEETTDDKFHSLISVVDKLLDYAKFDLQDAKIAALMAELQDKRTTIKDMNNTNYVDKTHLANTYTRWGRSSCPGNATLVYEGFAAGARYNEAGGAVNYMCLPFNPTWDNYKDNQVVFSTINGGEYETRKSVVSNFNSLQDHEVPCAVCRVQRTNVIMVPGRNVCYQDYDMEYKGYLMAGYPSDVAASEYVCVDSEAEQAINSSTANEISKVFYFVQAKCGSLKCPPYKEGYDVTCVVCSFSP